MLPLFSTHRRHTFRIEQPAHNMLKLFSERTRTECHRDYVKKENEPKSAPNGFHPDVCYAKEKQANVVEVSWAGRSTKTTNITSRDSSVA